MKKVRLLCASLGVVAIALVTEIHAGPQKLDAVRVISFGVPLPITIAKSQGLFAKYGIEVETQSIRNSDDLRSGLADGKADIAHAAVDNAVAMVENTGADVIIVSGGYGAVNELIGQPGIKSIIDLRGRTLLVDAPNTAYAIQLKKILLNNGIQPGKDCEIRKIGSTPIRLAAMREHPDYAGSM